MDAPKGKGEIAEMEKQLGVMQNPKYNTKEGIGSKRELFKRIIGYMTIGIDVSPLFAAMTITAGSGDDLIIKKMLYLYITHYAKSSGGLALLMINTLQKDCVNQDPVVRGLALRNLCSLKVANLVEYLESPVAKGLADKNAYVRRSAVMGVLKIYHLEEAAVHRTNLLGSVKELLGSDSDPQVIANCLRVIKEIEGIDALVDKSLVYGLLNRMKDFNEWSQCLILEIVSAYCLRLSGEEEMFEIMNHLEDRLQSANSAVVLATVRVFLHGTLAIGDSASHQEVLERIKAPMFTLVGSASAEVAFALLSHLEMLVTRA